MNSKTFRAYSTRLNLLYTQYFASLRATFFPSPPRAVRARAERPRQGWRPRAK